MSRSPVPRPAIDASLWFLLARNLEAEKPVDSAAAQLEPEVVDAVRDMLHDQGSAPLVSAVLHTVRAGRERLAQDPALTLSAQRYDRLRADFFASHQITGGKGKTLWPVGSTTALKQADGSWSAALAQAGLGTSTTPKPAGFGRARFTAEQFQAAIREFQDAAGEEGFAPTYQAYLRWQGEHKQQGRTDLPSGAAIRNSFGGWSAALASGDQQR